jgi:hypothetical protein
LSGRICWHVEGWGERRAPYRGEGCAGSRVPWTAPTSYPSGDDLAKVSELASSRAIEVPNVPSKSYATTDDPSRGSLPDATWQSASLDTHTVANSGCVQLPMGTLQRLCVVLSRSNVSDLLGSQRLWTPLWTQNRPIPACPNGCGPGLEIYGSEGWGFESVRACHGNPRASSASWGRRVRDLLTFGSHPCRGFIESRGGCSGHRTIRSLRTPERRDLGTPCRTRMASVQP